MMTSGQLWVSRRIEDIITAIERAASDIHPAYYPNSQSYITDVLDEVLSHLYDGSATELDSDSFNDKYSSVITTLEEIFGDDLKQHYDSVFSNEQETLNESEVYKNIEKLIKHWKNQLKKGEQIRFETDDLELWGITKRSDKMRTQLLFQELVGDEVFAEKFIKKLLNKTFSTKDFNERIVGGYDFEWIITQMNYQDFDFFLYGQTLPGGSVSLMDGRHMSLQEATEDEDLGWEIQNEVNDVVQDCMNEIILPATGYDVEVPVIYIAEE